MIIQIFDKLCHLNNDKKDDAKKDGITDETVAEQANEVLKYLSFLEIFCYNNLNLKCI